MILSPAGRLLHGLGAWRVPARFAGSFEGRRVELAARGDFEAPPPLGFKRAFDRAGRTAVVRRRAR